MRLVWQRDQCQAARRRSLDSSLHRVPGKSRAGFAGSCSVVLRVARTLLSAWNSAPPVCRRLPCQPETHSETLIPPPDFRRFVTRILQIADFLLTNPPYCRDSIPLALKVRSFMPPSRVWVVTASPSQPPSSFASRHQASLQRRISAMYRTFRHNLLFAAVFGLMLSL